MGGGGGVPENSGDLTQIVWTDAVNVYLMIEQNISGGRTLQNHFTESSALVTEEGMERMTAVAGMDFTSSSH